LTDDRELWDRLCRRDATAFEELYRTYSAGLQVFLRRALGSHQAAEDVTQETFYDHEDSEACVRSNVDRNYRAFEWSGYRAGTSRSRDRTISRIEI